MSTPTSYTKEAVDQYRILLGRYDDLMNVLDSDTGNYESIMDLYGKMINPPADLMYRVIMVSIKNNYLISASRFVHEHCSNLLPNQLANILQKLYDYSGDQMMETVKNMSEQILLTNKICPNKKEGLPFIVAAEHGFTEVVDNILANKILFHYERIFNIGTNSVTVPYSAVYTAYAHCNYATMKKILKRIIKDTPNFTTKMLLPTCDANLAKILDKYETLLKQFQQEIDNEGKEDISQTKTKEKENPSEFY